VSPKPKKNNGAPLGFEQKLWAAADKMRGHMDPAEYKHVALGLIFLKYISDAFEEKHSALLAEAEEEAARSPATSTSPRTSSGYRTRRVGRTFRPTPSSPTSASSSTTPWWRSSARTPASRAC
jgi:type I restriction-modification system DNA methylase subunit